MTPKDKFIDLLDTLNFDPVIDYEIEETNGMTTITLLHGSGDAGITGVFEFDREGQLTDWGLWD